MTTSRHCPFLMMTLVLAASLVSAQSGEPKAWFEMDENAPSPLNRFRLGYRAGLNISVNFKNAGGFSQSTDPGPATGGANHNYEDGYNRVDSSGNAGGATWNWGYENSSQVPGDGFIYMHSSSSAVSAAEDKKDGDPQHGLELIYNRQLGRSEHFLWGIEGAFNFTDLSIRDRQAAGGSVSLTTDRYDLGGVVPSMPPYHGTFEGPVPGGPIRPVISDSPMRTISSATASGERRLDADLYGFRVGPYLEAPLTKRLAVSLSGGLALGVASSDFSFHETVVSPSTAMTLNRSGRDSRTEVLLGAFVAGNLSYAINNSWSLFAGAQYQYLGCYTQPISDKQATVDLSKSVFVTAGLGFSF